MSRCLARKSSPEKRRPASILCDLDRLCYAWSMTEALRDERDIVLVVGDEELAEETIQEMVEQRGCLTVSHTNPALHYHVDNSPTITPLIAGLTMPLVSGPELIRNLLQINPKVSIILVTGHADEQIPDDIRPLVRHILPKPFMRSELFHAVRTALGKVGHQHPSA